MKRVVVTGIFDDLRSRHIRFLEEASKQGNVHVLLWSDRVAHTREGTTPRFPQEERSYLLQAIRYVDQVTLMTGPIESDLIAWLEEVRPDVWVVDERDHNAAKVEYCGARGVAYRVLKEEDLEDFPGARFVAPERQSPRKKVIATGCFDWFHSGHVRFFEEVSALGDLYVVVGHDENIRLLKGEEHPMFPQEERRYVVQSIRYVEQALISTGHGWMDAAPEIDRIEPDIYAVNEDGDQPEKREFCNKRGLEYVVLKRTPREGIPKRTSTTLRGF